MTMKSMLFCLIAALIVSVGLNLKTLLADSWGPGGATAGNAVVQYGTDGALPLASYTKTQLLNMTPAKVGSLVYDSSANIVLQATATAQAGQWGYATGISGGSAVWTTY